MVHVCMNGTMVNTNVYSSPVPVVGLYIAAAGFLCFLLILCDIWAGFRSKKLWFPCRFFSINSITLSLISIATKIPVDLTTTMPSAQDQLSKLSGTVFICMTMSFMLPSLAVNAEFESYANVTALSIFVVTVAVNICIQITTGVIFSFITEHVIILVCMLVLLVRFWFAVSVINGLKRFSRDANKSLVRNGGKDLFKRLEICYLIGYHYSLQFISCKGPFLADVTPVCITCSLVLIQATLKSFVFNDIKFCNGASDYGWSMWLVVVSQVLTVAAVSFAVGVRWATKFAHLSHWLYDFLPNFNGDDPYLQFLYFFSVKSLPKFLEKCFRCVIYYPLLFISFVVVGMNTLVQIIPAFGLVKCGIVKTEDEKDEKLQEFETLLSSRGIIGEETWLLRKSVADMERWMKINRKASFQHLTNLLSTIPPSQESSSSIGFKCQGLKISTLSVMILVEIAKVMKTPTLPHNISLANILAEAFDVIHFIDKKLNVQSSRDRQRFMFAQVIHEYGFSHGVAALGLAGDLIMESGYVWIDFRLKSVCGTSKVPIGEAIDAIREPINDISNFINYGPRESREAVYGRIEQLFVDTLHVFLSQLPAAIFTHIVESPVEEYQERVKLCLGFLCQAQSLEHHIRFSLPPGSGVTSLFGTESDLLGT